MRVYFLLPLLLLSALTGATAQQAFEKPPVYLPAPSELERVRNGMLRLEAAASGLDSDGAADCLVFLHTARLAEDLGLYRSTRDLQPVLDGLELGLARANLIRQGERPWLTKPGRSLRGFRSRVDGSIQPYSVVLPAGFTANDPRAWPVEVFLHGRGTSEVRFLIESENPGRPAAAAPEQPHIELHPFGRGNNGWRWAGETDVFEALRELQRRYRIDPDRISLRGFSMGGHGAWHIGLHYPDLWSAVSPGAGFTDTIRYQKLKEPLPADQGRLLHIYDAVDYAANLENTPFVGYGGEEDPQIQATLMMGEAAAKAGAPLQMIIGPKTGHTYHPESLKQIRQIISRAVRRPAPEKLRFTTWTLRYNRCHWVTLDGLSEHYRRAEVKAHREGDMVTVSSEGVTGLTIAPLPWPVKRVVLDGSTLPMDAQGGSFRRENGRWRPGQASGLRKKHGLQGPLDDAFTAPFLVVEPTGISWRAETGHFVDTELARMRAEWLFGFRGRLPVVADRDLTPRQARDHHLILLGDPSSNSVLARLIRRLPLKWSRSRVELAGAEFGADVIPQLIHPNPEAPGKYVVLNSGHSFNRVHLDASNAWLFPQFGDWSLIRMEDGQVKRLAGGFSDERWQPRR